MSGISRRAFGLGMLAVAAARPEDQADAIAGQADAVEGQAGAVMFGAYAYEGSDLGVSQPEALEAAIGRRFAINHCFQHAGIAPHLTRMRQDIADGRTPMISWGAGPEPRLTEILQKKHDKEIETQAAELAKLDVPVLLRFTWEFDLRYKDAKLFTDVWRYVHWKFAGAPKVAFVWCPTWRAYRETGKADDLYPGDAYVDWIAADGYARPRPDNSDYDYRPFDLMFDAGHLFAAERDKPFMVGETGVHRAATDSRQATWLNATRTVIKSSYPALKAFVYFHRDADETDSLWRVTGPGLTAFRAFGADPYFGAF